MGSGQPGEQQHRDDGLTPVSGADMFFADNSQRRPRRNAARALLFRNGWNSHDLMARHPTARRVHRPPATADDAFIERVLESSVWVKQHQRTLTILGVVAVLLILGFFWYRNQRERVMESAATQLTEVRQTMLSGNQALAIRDLERFLRTYGRTPAAPEARVLLAQAYLESNQPQKAITAIQNDASDLNAPLGPSAAFLLAESYEVTSQFDRAEEIYLRVADRAPFVFQKERALDAVARIRTERGNTTGAVEAYDRLLEMLPADNPDRAVFEMRRAEAQARAGTDQLRAGRGETGSD